MRTSKAFMLLLATLAVAPLPLQAQGVGRPFEFGLDAAAQFGLGDNSYTLIVLPAQRARVGYEFNNSASFEPFAGFTYFNISGASTMALDLGAGLLFYISGTNTVAPTTMAATVSRIYLRPFVLVQYQRASGGGFTDSNTDFGFGGGVGLRQPIGSTHLATRWEVSLQHVGGSSATTSLGLSVGLSFFTR